MKKALSVLLCLCLVLSVFSALPFTASAATLDEAAQSTGVSSGTTGDCTWTLDDEGTLTISGSGKMGDYAKSVLPWGKEITAVVFNDGVTYIGMASFRECKKLRSVLFPETLTQIGSYAFDGCTSLVSISFPNSLTNISMCAFRNCIGLKDIIVPDNLTNIAQNVFENTYWFNNQPDGLVYIGKIAYKYKGTCSNSVEIQDGTVGIAGGAFSDYPNYSGLTSVSIPESVTRIGESSFFSAIV